MRILCLNIQSEQIVITQEILETFLIFSPRIQLREPNLIFCDVQASSHLFGGEPGLLQAAFKLSQDLDLQAFVALSDSPWTAQIFSSIYPNFLSSPTEDSQNLKNFPTHYINQMEGLKPWPNPSQIRYVSEFLNNLGLNSFAQLESIPIEQWQTQFGEIGQTIWKRLHFVEQQVISPLISNEPLEIYDYFLEPIHQTSVLLTAIEKKLKSIFLRLQGRGCFAHSLQILLRCEYSDKDHHFVVQPTEANRDLSLYIQMIERKLNEVNLENPIREYEIKVRDCPEKAQQLNFWEPQTRDHDKVSRLLNLISETCDSCGFFNLNNQVLPEKTWSINTSPRRFEPQQDVRKTDGLAHKILPAYGKGVSHSPRPTRLLGQPQILSDSDLQQLHLLHWQPTEIIEAHWWQDPVQRKYYIAASQQGEFYWIFKNNLDHHYYLHGYFD